MKEFIIRFNEQKQRNLELYNDRDIFYVLIRTTMSYFNSSEDEDTVDEIVTKLYFLMNLAVTIIIYNLLF